MCIFVSHTFVPISWLCADFSFTQFYNGWNHFSRCKHAWIAFPFSLSGIWELKYVIPHRTNRRTKREWRGNPSAVVKLNMHKPIPIKHTNVIPRNSNHIPFDTRKFDSSALWNVFDISKAVLKEIIKGRSSTMRHVPRTHKVALDHLFDKIDLDPKIRIRYIDTKHNSQTFWPEGIKFHTWFNLHLLNVSHFSSNCFTKNFSLISCSTLAKRIQNPKVESVVSSNEFFFVRQVLPQSPIAI